MARVMKLPITPPALKTAHDNEAQQGGAHRVEAALQAPVTTLSTRSLHGRSEPTAEATVYARCNIDVRLMRTGQARRP